MTVASLALALTVLGHPNATPADHVRARLLATTMLSAAARYHLDAVLLAAIPAHESRFDPSKVGAAGERGACQILPATAALMGYPHLTPEALAHNPINLHICAKYLAHVRSVCAKRGITGDAAMLSKFNGGRCAAGTKTRSGAYSRAILRLAGEARDAIEGMAGT